MYDDNIVELLKLACKVCKDKYDENGMHGGKIEFEGSPENMTNFIMYNKMHPVVIADMVDQFVVSSTMGGILDRVAYPALREEIIKEILPLL